MVRVLRLLWSRWRAFGRVMGDVVARVVLTLFYFTVALPFGLGVRLFGDPLRVRKPELHWVARADRKDTLDGARKLY